MNINKTNPCLYIVATPIGNLQDISLRALAILKEVDYILCEDTRVTKKLLSHFKITTPMISYHTYNEDFRTEEVLSLLEKNINIALVSDAGTPLISDPGYPLITRALEKNYQIISIPGANAALSALVASGLPADKYLFYGFLSSRKNKRRLEITKLQTFPYTIIFYEAPHRINDTLNDLYELLGSRQIVVAKEITKIYEQYFRGSVDEIKDLNYKGELVIVLKGASSEEQTKKYLDLPLLEHLKYYEDLGLEQKEAMKKVASERKISKSIVYKALIEEKKLK